MRIIPSPLRQVLCRGMSMAGTKSKNGGEYCPAQIRRNEEMKKRISQYIPDLGNFIPLQKSEPWPVAISRHGFSVCPVQFKRVVQTKGSIQKKWAASIEKKT